MIIQDIPEGAASHQMPRIGFGRIRSAHRLNEWYATVSAFGKRIFIAIGKYDGVKYRPRYWIAH